MGKVEQQLPVQVVQAQPPPGSRGGLGGFVARVLGVFSFRCVTVLVLSFCVCLSVVFWLPPFRPFGSGSRGGGGGHQDALIQASFNLQMPLELVDGQKEMMEFEIFEEIGSPYTKVSILSMVPFSNPNWTSVVFGVLPYPSDGIIPDVTLSVLRSSFIGLVLLDYNLTLTPSVFGKPSSFEILKFPGGVTVPGQSSFLSQLNEILFNFTLNNSISQIEKNLYQLKDELKNGLKLRPNENVYVRMTNLDGSTVAPPVIVQASVFSDIGSGIVLPQRLKQLAEALRGYHDQNLGLDHAVFGKVKQVQLSSYLQHSLGSSPSPSPDPVPTIPAPAPCDHSHFVLSPSPNPSIIPGMPLPPSGVYAPSLSPIPHVEPPENEPRNSFPPLTSPAPSISVNAQPPLSSPIYVPVVSPNTAPALDPIHSPIFPPTASQKGFPSPPRGQPGYPIQRGPTLSPTAAVPNALSPKHNYELDLERSPDPAPFSMSAPPISSAASTYQHMLLIWLNGLGIFYLFCCCH